MKVVSIGSFVWQTTDKIRNSKGLFSYICVMLSFCSDFSLFFSKLSIFWDTSIFICQSVGTPLKTSKRIIEQIIKGEDVEVAIHISGNDISIVVLLLNNWKKDKWKKDLITDSQLPIFKKDLPDLSSLFLR